MGQEHRLIGYVVSFATASVFSLLWQMIELARIGKQGHVSASFLFGLAIFFWMFEGMAVALVLLAFPWYLVVRAYGWMRRFSWIYFSLTGAMLMLVLGCATSSLAPKPLFIEDQTFVEGFVIAAERQGLCLLLTGFVFGLTFWIVSERLRPFRSVEA